MTSSEPAYSRTAIALHWLIAAGIFVAFPLGVYMSDLPLSPDRLKLFSWHKWLGITILMLAVLRLLWRAGHKPPAPVNMARWQQWSSRTVHVLLYLLIFAIPLSGWLMSSAKGFQTVWFGVVPLPDLISKDKAMGRLLTDVHETLNFTLLGLVALHAAAALKHHFFDRDSTLRRMLPILRAR